MSLAMWAHPQTRCTQSKVMHRLGAANALGTQPKAMNRTMEHNKRFAVYDYNTPTNDWKKTQLK